MICDPVFEKTERHQDWSLRSETASDYLGIINHENAYESQEMESSIANHEEIATVSSQIELGKQQRYDSIPDQIDIQ